MSHQHLDAKIVKNFPLNCMGGNLLLNRLVNPYQSWYARGGIKKTIEEWLLLSSMCAVVYSYCMSHQHADAKIVISSLRDVWVVSHRNVWVGTYI